MAINHPISGSGAWCALRRRFSTVARSARGPFLALALLTACHPGEEPTSPEVPVTEQLSHALELGRWIEPRITGGSGYQECASSECPDGRLLCEPACADREGSTGRHLFAGTVSLSSGGDEASADERRAEALWNLLARADEGGADEAIEMLQQLVAKDPTDAGLLSDLAAAHIVQAQRSDEPVALVDALISAEKALAIEDRLPEAHFNRALASTLLGLGPDARASWRTYLEGAEESSPWATEARRRLREIVAAGDPVGDWERAKERIATAGDRGDRAAVRALVDHFRTAARLWVEEEILPDWARAAAQGREGEAERYLGLARLVAAELSALRGGRLLADAVGAIDEATADRRTNRLERLMEGHRAYGEAARAFRVPDIDTAMRAYRRAHEMTDLAESPFSAWAEVGLAFGLFQSHRVPEALEVLTRLRAEAETSGYATLQGRILWILGLCQFYASLPIEARHSYQAALERYLETGERENQANLSVRLAEIYRHVGDDGKAWRLRLQALRQLPWVVGRRSRHYILAETSSALLELPLPDAARELQAEAVRISRAAADDPLNLAIALRHYAEVSASLEDRVQAQAVIDEAFRLSGQVPEPVGSAIRARIRVVEGRLAQRAAPQRAIDSFTGALDLMPRNEYLGYRARLYFERSAAYRERARIEGGNAELEKRAVDDLASGLREIDEEWKQVLTRRERGADEELWSPYFGRPQETFDLMIRLLVEDGRHAKAFEYAEKARARDLLALVAGVPTSHRALDRPLNPLMARAVEEELPLGTVLVEHALLDDRLLLWIFRHGQMTPKVVERSREAVDAWASEIQRAAQEGDLDLDADVLAELSSALLPPVKAVAQPGDELVFVPDGSLHGVPFAALKDPESGRFLIEDHPISVAPSATLYLYAQERERAFPRTDDPAALFIGDPAFDASRFLGLHRLPHAIEEARQGAAQYPTATLLEGEEATRDAFLRHAGEHEIVHFAGHAVLNPEALFRAMLVLAPSAGTAGSGALYADELLKNELPRTRLVVLSACSTAGGHPVGALGVAPLVRPFLGAGVPAVVGSLWDVDDPAAERLLTEFHRLFRGGVDAASALQQASLALLEDDRRAFASPRSWAAFQVIGTTSLSPPGPPQRKD